MFIVFSGISSSGKNTIMSELVSRRENIKILTSSSGTTRAKRESDDKFKTYCYMSEEEFKKGINEGKFFEYEIVHGNYYGLILSRLVEVLNDKENDYVRDVDVKGNVSLKSLFGDNMISIFLDAPNEVLYNRLKERGESEEEIEKRLSRSELERSYKKNYDLVVENIDIDKTVNEILEFLDKRKKEV